MWIIFTIFWDRLLRFLEHGLYEFGVLEITSLFTRDYSQQWAAFAVFLALAAVILLKGYEILAKLDVRLATPEGATFVFLTATLLVPIGFGFALGWVPGPVVSHFTLLLYFAWLALYMRYVGNLL